MAIDWNWGIEDQGIYRVAGNRLITSLGTVKCVGPILRIDTPSQKGIVMVDPNVVPPTRDEIRRNTRIVEEQLLGWMSVRCRVSRETDRERTNHAEERAGDRPIDVVGLRWMGCIPKPSMGVRRQREGRQHGILNRSRGTFLAPASRNNMLLGTYAGSHKLHARGAAIGSIERTSTTIPGQVPVDKVIIRKRSAENTRSKNAGRRAKGSSGSNRSESSIGRISGSTPVATRQINGIWIKNGILACTVVGMDERACARRAARARNLGTTPVGLAGLDENATLGCDENGFLRADVD